MNEEPNTSPTDMYGHWSTKKNKFSYFKRDAPKHSANDIKGGI